jgi:hypothetical protein
VNSATTAHKPAYVNGRWVPGAWYELAGTWTWWADIDILAHLDSEVWRAETKDTRIRVVARSDWNPAIARQFAWYCVSLVFDSVSREEQQAFADHYRLLTAVAHDAESPASLELVVCDLRTQRQNYTGALAGALWYASGVTTDAARLTHVFCTARSAWPDAARALHWQRFCALLHLDPYPVCPSSD